MDLVFKKDCVTGGFEPQQQLVWTTGRVQCWNHCKPPSRCAISDQLFDTAVSHCIPIRSVKASVVPPS